jgi:hypothetical protein
MSLAHTTYLLATDAAFRRAFQADPAAAVAVTELALDPEEQGLLADLQHLLTLSPQELRTILQVARLRRWVVK